MNEINNYYNFTRTEMADLLPQTYSKVLEIGCAAGQFKQNLSYDCEYWGVEMNPESAKKAENKLDKVLTGTYETVLNDIPDNYFDLVICNDVIEHMPDHDFFFESIKQKITKDAYITGSIPNVRYIRNIIGLLIKKDWKYKNQGVLDRTHLRFFTKKSLKRSFNEHRYKIDTFCGLNCIWNKQNSIKKISNFIVFFIPALLLGQDTKFKQFGFCIKK